MGAALHDRNVSVLVAQEPSGLEGGLRRLLEAEPGVQVVASANDGADTVAKSAQLRPTVVVLDVSTLRQGGGQEEGLRTTRAIVRDAPGTRVVLLSGNAAANSVREAISAGAHGYVLKESAGEEVAAAVLAVSAGGCYLGQGVPAQSCVGSAESVRPDETALRMLTRTEREIVRLVGEGRSNAEAATELGLSVRTVETYRGRLMHKLGLESVSALVKFAIRHGLTPPD